MVSILLLPVAALRKWVDHLEEHTGGIQGVLPLPFLVWFKVGSQIFAIPRSHSLWETMPCTSSLSMTTA